MDRTDRCDGDCQEDKTEAMIVIRGDNLAPRTARNLVADTFSRWGLDSDTARTIVSELVTNAHLHGCASTETNMIVVRTWLRADGAAVEVWDPSDTMPIRGTENDTAESGRGLLMVEQLAEGWGARPLANGGKVVWAACKASDLEDRPRPARWPGSAA